MIGGRFLRGAMPELHRGAAQWPARGEEGGSRARARPGDGMEVGTPRTRGCGAGPGLGALPRAWPAKGRRDGCRARGVSEACVNSQGALRPKPSGADGSPRPRPRPPRGLWLGHAACGRSRLSPGGHPRRLDAAMLVRASTRSPVCKPPAEPLLGQAVLGAGTWRRAGRGVRLWVWGSRPPPPPVLGQRVGSWVQKAVCPGPCLSRPCSDRGKSLSLSVSYAKWACEASPSPSTHWPSGLGRAVQSLGASVSAHCHGAQ